MPIVLVVESPNKIKKIEHILGNGYKVIASVGHIMDLDPNKMSVELDNDFKPIYIVNADKKTVVANIKKISNTATELLLATDEDREGEMIAWSVANVLKLDIKKAKRITFNAITKSEITNAIKNPRIINTNLVDAQKARRILDRIVGYELSPLLSKHLGSGNLSAGRVQSVVARLIVDRENEIKKFLEGDMKSFFKFKGEFTSNKKLFNANAYDLDKKSKNNEYKGEQSKITGEDKSKKFMETCSTSTFKVEHVFDKKKTRGPSPPFTTSTLQQDANRKCGFSVKKTMMVAQKLYEAGYITYMRTDSVNLSDEAMKEIKKYIIDTYGEEYYRYVQYKSKSKNTQEAHEAIRPTEIITTDISDDENMGTDEVRLYSLIWKRAVASQMKPAEFNVTSIQISISKDKEHFFQTSIENMTFAGFLTVYNVAEEEEEEEKDDENNTNKDVPIPKVGDILPLESLLGSQEYLKPPGRYNEASLVDKLDPKNLNIGRPATYSSIIDKIKTRKYVEIADHPGINVNSLTLSWTKESKKITEKKEKITICKEKNKFKPTHLGTLVNNFLVMHFPKLMDYKFTSLMEDKLDDVANGDLLWNNVLKEFYDEFHTLVVNLLKKTPEIKTKDMKLLGVDPKTKMEIFATTALYGPVVKMMGDNGKYIYAPIKEPFTLETVTLEHALDLFQYPKEIGLHEKKKILLNRGKFGLYLTHGKNKCALPEDKTTVTLEEAIKLLQTKGAAKSALAEFESEVKFYHVLEGPYGKYIKVTDKKTGKTFNANFPATEDIEDLTIEKVMEIINQKFQKGKNTKAPTKGGSKAPAKGVVKALAKGVVKAPAKGAVKAPAKSAVKAPAKGVVKAPAKGTLKSTIKAPNKSVKVTVKTVPKKPIVLKKKNVIVVDE